MQSIGFVILILGNLLYNRIVKFNCLENDDEEGMYFCMKKDR